MSRPTTPAASRHPPRKRLGGACRACHSRKVRCDLAKCGRPCTNCSLDEIECELRARNPYGASTTAGRPRPARPSPPNQARDPETREASITVLPPELNAQPAASKPHNPAPGTNSIGTPDSLPRHADGTRTETSKSGAPRSDRPSVPRSGGYRPFESHFSHFHEDDAVDAESLPADTPIYADPTGVYAIANICEPAEEDRSGHYLLPNGIVSSFDPDDLEYLRVKSAFVFPEARIRENLVRTYFHYIHPFFPIVDVQDFLPKHESGALDKIGAHLLWSVYLAASNFLEEDVVRAAGFASRKEMKLSTFRKAKALYDMQYEKDRAKLIQAVLLMSFHSSDTEDKSGPRHWIGIAINLCHTAGLHRNPHPTAGHIPPHRQRLWRLIWWSCVHQDAWFSVGMGRPMRIHLDDCNTQLPVASDLDAMIAGVAQPLRDKYLPTGMSDLSQLFVELVRLAIIQANVLSTHHRIRQTRPSSGDLEEIDQQILTILKKVTSFMSSENSMVYYHTCHLVLFLQSVRVCLYRPYLLNFPRKGPSSLSQEWYLSVERKAQGAAAGFNQILEILITSDMISACQAITCIALVPPMQIHLLNSTSGKPLIATLGRHALDVCMLVADELRKTYFGAELLHRLFSQAKRLLMNRKTQQVATEDTQPTEAASRDAQSPRPTQGSQDFTDTNTIKNLGSAFNGLDGIYGGYDFAIGSNLDFVFPPDLGDDVSSGQNNRWYWELPTENSFQVDEMDLQ